MCVLPTDEGGDGDGDGDGDGAGDGDGDGDGDGAGDGDGDGDGDPDCYDETQAGDFLSDLPLPVLCGLELNCPSVGFISAEFESEYGPDAYYCGNPVYDPAQAACVVEGLRQGTPGAYRLEDCGGQFGRDRILEILDEGVVLFHNTLYQDLGYQQRETLRILPEPAYFDACSVATPEDFIACIDGIVDAECLPGPIMCP